MTIEIIEERPIRLTKGEYERLLHEFEESRRHYAGHHISFETWLREKRERMLANPNCR